MSNNTIQTKVKPNLTSNEKKRYAVAAEHFMKGASDFYIKHYGEVKKIVDVDYIKNSFQKKYKEYVDEFKEKINEKVDYIKEASKEGLSRFIAVVLTSSLVVLGVAAIMPDKIKELFSRFYDYLKPIFAESANSNYLLSFTNFMKRWIPNLDISNEINDALKNVWSLITDILNAFMDVIHNFFNGEWAWVFEELISLTVAEVFNRSFDSSFGKILKFFFSLIDVKVRQRPDLYNFCKFGSVTFKEVTEVELLFDKLTKQSTDGGTVSNSYNEGWVFMTADSTKGGGARKNWYQVGDLSAFRDLSNKLHVRYADAAAEFARNSPLTNPFDIVDPYAVTTPSGELTPYGKARAELNNFMNGYIDAKGYAEYVSSGEDSEVKFQKGINYYYKGNGFDEVYEKLEEFKKYFKHSKNPVVIESIKRYKDIKARADKRRFGDNEDFKKTTGLNMEDANELLLIMLVLATEKRRMVLDELKILEIEFHSFKGFSELDNRISFLKGLHKDFNRDAKFNRLHTLKNFDEVFKKTILKEKLHPDGGFDEATFNEDMSNLERNETDFIIHLSELKRYELFSSLMLDDLFDGQLSVFKISNKIKALYDEVKASLISWTDGSENSTTIRRENIYYFNNYSESTDTTITSMELEVEEEDDPKKKKKKNKDSAHFDVKKKTLKKKTINNTTNVEAVLNLCLVYTDAKVLENEVISQRNDLLSDIIDVITGLADFNLKYNKELNKKS